jgi:hypothetical protein
LWDCIDAVDDGVKVAVVGHLDIGPAGVVNVEPASEHQQAARPVQSSITNSKIRNGYA